MISLLYITPISLGEIAFEQEIKEALLTPEEEEHHHPHQQQHKHHKEHQHQHQLQLQAAALAATSSSTLVAAAALAAVLAAAQAAAQAAAAQLNHIRSKFQPIQGLLCLVTATGSDVYCHCCPYICTS